MLSRKYIRSLEKALHRFKQHYKPNELNPDCLLQNIQDFYYDAIGERKNIANERIKKKLMLKMLSQGNLNFIIKICFNYHVPPIEIILCLQTLVDLGVTSAYLFLGNIYFHESRQTYLGIAAYYLRKAYDAGYSQEKLDPLLISPLEYFNLRNPNSTLSTINDWFNLHSWPELYRAMYHVSQTITPSRFYSYLIHTQEFLQQLQSEDNDKIKSVLERIKTTDKIQADLDRHPEKPFNNFALLCKRNHFFIHNMLLLKLPTELSNFIFLFVANDLFKLPEKTMSDYQWKFFKNRSSYQETDLPNSLFNSNNKIIPRYFQ